MSTTNTIYKYERKALFTAFEEKSNIKEIYGGVQNFVSFESHLLVSERPSKTLIVLSHPVGGGAYLPMVTTLAKCGFHVLYINGRYRGNDTALIMEKCVIDMAEAIKYVKEKFGYEKIIIAGWSGGGSLGAFYQSQAENPTITQTPAGDPIDIAGHNLVAADGFMFLAAHVCRAKTLTEWMDASIIDESDPYKRDPELDLFNPDNPNKPPYSQEFLDRYRAAQLARNRKITGWVKGKLEEQKKNGREFEEICFVTPGTFADPKQFDHTLDANDRHIMSAEGDANVDNNSPSGLARVSTLRSWLSQWSYDDTNADAEVCAADISKPTLVIANSADQLCTPSHTQRLYDAIRHNNKEVHEIKGANHYYFGQPELAQEAAGKIIAWADKYGFVD